MNTLTKLELLAPAKNLECGIAAINHGADAVYIGAPRFGARAAAGNSISDIRQLCVYAHRYGVRVYVTVNTIIYDDELDDTRQLLQQLYEAGVDAVLVQDMAVLKMKNERLKMKDLILHASTQTDNRTPEKVRWLHSLGFRRVVLARELSVDEIREIHRQVPDVELEVFVHGALCVSYSGLCYASQHCFSRSANRGECAQFCRMPFDLLDADGHELQHQRHLLSLKDLCQIHHLEEFIEAGATSFKIEGRLKDVTYVKNVVAAYHERLQQIVSQHPERYCRASQGHCTIPFTPHLQKTFNRGFTTYFLHGRQPDIFSPDTPKAIGEFVGKVKELRRDSFNVSGTASFSNGDGLCFIDDQRQLQGFRVNRVAGNRLFPHQMPSALRPGMALYRNSDQEFLRQLSHATIERKLPITLRLSVTPDGFALSALHVEAQVACPHQLAAKPQSDNIIRQLSRWGATAYECSGVELPSDFNLFIPNSILAQLRQNLQQMLEAAEADQHRKDENHDDSLPDSARNQPSVPMIPADSGVANISNHLAKQFYGASSLTAYELNENDGPIMQCRHCLRYSLGHCVKHGGRKPQWKEPLVLRLGDGRCFRLEFDCKNCQMNIYASR